MLMTNNVVVTIIMLFTMRYCLWVNELATLDYTKLLNSSAYSRDPVNLLFGHRHHGCLIFVSIIGLWYTVLWVSTFLCIFLSINMTTRHDMLHFYAKWGIHTANDTRTTRLTPIQSWVIHNTHKPAYMPIIPTHSTHPKHLWSCKKVTLVTLWCAPSYYASYD